MPSNPSQIFDFSAQIAALETHDSPKSPPAAPLNADFSARLALEEFDSAAFERTFRDVAPEVFARDAIRKGIAEVGATQLAMWKAAPQYLVAHLLKTASTKHLFLALKSASLAKARALSFRGFQFTPNLVRHPTVQKRLTAHFCAHRTELFALFLAVKLCNTPAPQSLSQSPDEPLDELETEESSFDLCAQQGPLETLLFTIARARPDRFFPILDLIENDRESYFARLRQRNEGLIKIGEKKQSPPAAPETQGGPPPDSDAARFWHERAEKLEECLQNVGELVQKSKTLVAENLARDGEIKALKLELEKLRAHEKQTIQSWEKKWDNALKKWQLETTELKKHDERQTRRWHKVERENEELQTELKKAKKQLRNAQQILEDERKRASQLQNELETLKNPTLETVSETPSTTISREEKSPESVSKKAETEPITPLDDVFEWRADGRLWRVSGRQIKRLIDANDEENLWPIQMALQVLEKSDREAYNRLFFRLRSEDFSYERVLKESTQRVLVDASNVARYQKNKHGRGILKNLLSMRDELRRLGCWPIILVADASLRHNIDEGKKFAQMLERGEVIQSDKGVEADEILAREARTSGASVVTNDAKFFHKVSPDFEPPRITFRIFDGTVIVDDF